MHLCARRSAAAGLACKGMPMAVGDSSGSRGRISKLPIPAREISAGSRKVVAGPRGELAACARRGTRTSIAGNGRSRQPAAEPASYAGAHATSTAESTSAAGAHASSAMKATATVEASSTAMKAATTPAALRKRGDGGADKQNSNS